DQNRHTSRERFHHTSPSLDGREAIHASGSRPNTGLWWRFRVPPPTRRVAPPRLIVETNVEQPKHDRDAVPLLVTGGLYPTSSSAPRPSSNRCGDGPSGHLPTRRSGGAAAPTGLAPTRSDLRRTDSSRESKRTRVRARFR